jgi:hypothetical protein
MYCSFKKIDPGDRMLAFVLFWFAFVELGVFLEAYVVSSEFESKEAYLLKVNQELHRKRPLLFTSQRSAIIASFEQTFGVVISAQSAFPYFLKTECLTQSKTFELDGFSARSINFRVSEDGVFLNSSIPKLRLRITADGIQCRLPRQWKSLQWPHLPVHWHRVRNLSAHATIFHVYRRIRERHLDF